MDSEGWSSLHSACANGNADIVRELLRLKSKVEAMTNKQQTPLHLAVYSGSFDCVEQLLNHKANINVATAEERNTPLHMACESGFAHMAQLLIQKGANIHARNVMDRTPLHCVGISGRTDLGILLLRAGAKHDVRDAHDWTPCQIAELFGHMPFQELMIRQGMTEKQAVFKDLPPAAWHSTLWSSVVDMQEQRREEFQREQVQVRTDEEDLRRMKEDRLQESTKAKRDVRQAELELYRRNQMSTIIQEARNHVYNDRERSDSEEMILMLGNGEEQQVVEREPIQRIARYVPEFKFEEGTRLSDLIKGCKRIK